MQKKQNHTATVLIVAGLIVAGIFLTSMVPVNNESNPPQPPKAEDSPRSALERTLGQYLQFLSQSSDWWMVSTPPPTKETAEALTMALSNVSNALASARSATPITEEICQNFNQFFSSVFEKGISRVTMVGDVDITDFRGKTEVCFFSRSESAGTREKIGGIVWYREDWRAVMIAGVRWGGPQFGGLLYHELYHALQHRKGESAPTGSEKDIQEEVDAHELETVVLDYLTKGKYLREAEAVLRDHPQASDERALFGVVTTNSFLRLDKALGLENFGADVRGTSVAQHLVTLGFRFIDKRGGTKEDKVALYRWIRKG